jgi:DNA-binding NarL/FixJ family response regulator
MSKRRKAFDLFEKGRSVDEVAAALKNRELARNYYWQWADPERYKELNNQAGERWRRRHGSKTMAQYIAEERALTRQRYTPIAKLLAKGASFTQAGAALGLTRNQVAGVVGRARNGGLA